MITSRADGTSRIRSWLWHALADFKYRSLRALSLAARDIISVWVLSFCAKTRPKRDATNIFLHIWRWTNSPGDVESLFGFIEFRKCNEPVAVTISLTTADQLKIGSKKKTGYSPMRLWLAANVVELPKRLKNVQRRKLHQYLVRMLQRFQEV